MADSLSPEHRSWNMSRIGSKNTGPEIKVRSILHKNGYRFRLNGKVGRKLYPKGYLPGKPDLVLAKYKAVIFINGCFWHQHNGCKKGTIPKTRTDWWRKKLHENFERDSIIREQLKNLGWKVLIVWECEVQGQIFLDELNAIKNEKDCYGNKTD
ncbi:MAG: DNA mismatch endonuclease patch repair protein [Chloroflexi bacterium]|nr:MAG: DNA mismatch endonuclease patch repair protein [Chloroflexota bacterium]